MLAYFFLYFEVQKKVTFLLYYFAPISIALGSLTNIVTTQPPASLAANTSRNTMPCVTWCATGQPKPEPYLLLPQSPDDFDSGRRRPADIFIPALAGFPAVLDFAITTYTRQETLAIASTTPGAAAAAYARHKAIYLATA